MAVKYAKQVLTKSEITEIIRMNIALYCDEPDFSEYLVNLTLYLVDQAYCDHGLRAGDLPEVLRELQHARSETVQEELAHVKKPEPPPDNATANIPPPPKMPPPPPASIPEEVFDEEPVLDEDGEPATNKVKLQQFKPIFDKPPMDYDIEDDLKRVKTEDIEIKHRIFDAPEEDFDLTTGQVKANELMKAMFADRKDESAEEPKSNDEQAPEENAESAEGMIPEEDFDDSQDLSVPSAKDLKDKRGVYPEDPKPEPAPVEEKKSWGNYGQPVKDDSVYGEDAEPPKPYSRGFKPETEEELMRTMGLKKSEIERQRYLREQGRIGQKKDDERPQYGSDIAGFGDNSGDNDSTANELMRHYRDSRDKVSLDQPCPVCGTYNPISREFCTGCGHRLITTPPEESPEG